MTEVWMLNDMKTSGFIAQGVAIEHLTKIWSATTANMAWNTLRDSYNRSTMHKRMLMTSRLQEFRMDSDEAIVKHLDTFDDLIVGMQTSGEPFDEARQLVIFLSGLRVDLVNRRNLQGLDAY